MSQVIKSSTHICGLHTHLAQKQEMQVKSSSRAMTADVGTGAGP